MRPDFSEGDKVIVTIRSHLYLTGKDRVEKPCIETTGEFIRYQPGTTRAWILIDTKAEGKRKQSFPISKVRMK